MSADNYYIVRNHPLGGFAAVMGFASDGRTPKARKRDVQFDTPEEALSAAMSDEVEYGHSIHPECFQSTTTTGSAAADRDVAIQALWDVYATLGFDADGDSTPAARVSGMGVAGFAQSVVNAAAEHRRETEANYDRDLADAERVGAAKALRSQAAKVARIREYGLQPGEMAAPYAKYIEEWLNDSASYVENGADW